MQQNSCPAYGIIRFPCHSKAKILVYEGAKGQCSAKCPSCDRFALFHLEEMKAEPIGAIRGAIHKASTKHTYID